MPRMVQHGYDASGVDPEAPEGRDYDRVEFEQYDVGQPVDAIVACTSLHHVHDLSEVLAKVARSLTSRGLLVVVEWDWTRWDESTARWCFARLPALSPEVEHPWPHTLRDRWAASGQSWESYLTAWAQEEGLHTGDALVQELDVHFACESLTRTPYFFADLADTTDADEQAAIDSGEVQATGLRYVGRPRPLGS